MKEITLEKLKPLKLKEYGDILLGDGLCVATPEWNQDVFGWVYAVDIPDHMNKRQTIDEVSKTLISQCRYKLGMMTSAQWYNETDPTYGHDGYLVLREK